MIAIVHSIYSQSVHAPASDAGLMDNDAERYCIMFFYYTIINCKQIRVSYGFHSSKITELYEFFIVDICLLTSLQHNP